MPLSARSTFLKISVRLCFLAAALSLMPLGRSARAELYADAMTLMAQGQYVEALAALEQLQPRNKKKALEGKLVLYRQLGDNQKIVETIRQLAAISGYTADLKIQEAIALRNMGGWEQAEHLMAEAAEAVNGNPVYLIEYGRYLLWKEDYAGAENAFGQALSLRPGDAQATLGMAYVRVWQGNDAEARVFVEQILSIFPDHVDALILSGWLAAWRQDFAAAAAAFGRTLGLSPNHPEALRGLAQTLAWDGQYGRSVEVYQALLQVQPGNVDVMLSFGRTLRENGDYAAAVDVLTQAQTLDPARVDVQQELAIAGKWTLELDATLRGLRRRVALNQGDVSDALTLGQTYSWLGKLKDSRKVFEQALARDPDNVQLLYGAGLVYEKLDDLDRAEKMFRRVLELKPDFVDAKLHIESMKFAYRPQLTAQYGLTLATIYDPTLLDTITLTQEHTVTTEYAQRLLSGYTLRAGYAFGMAYERDLFNDLPNYGAFHHKIYLQNELKFDHDITAVIRYDMHLYTNRFSPDNLVNLPGNEMEHGGYLLIQAPYAFNTFGFEFNRQFVLTNTGTELEPASVHTVTVSDDLEIAENVSALVAFAGNRVSLLEDWSWSGIIHPRAKLPFFPQAGLEYEWNFLTHPDRQIHRGIFNINFALGARIQNQFQYTLSYYTLPDDYGHTGQLIVGWAPSDRVSVSAVAVTDYFQSQFNVSGLLGGTYRF